MVIYSLIKTHFNASCCTFRWIQTLLYALIRCQRCQLITLGGSSHRHYLSDVSFYSQISLLMCRTVEKHYYLRLLHWFLQQQRQQRCRRRSFGLHTPGTPRGLKATSWFEEESDLPPHRVTFCRCFSFLLMFWAQISRWQFGTGMSALTARLSECVWSQTFI